MKKVKVNLGLDSYEVRIGAGALARAGNFLSEIGLTGRLVIITNPVVDGLYGKALRGKLAGEGFEVAVVLVPDGEEHKSLETAGRLYHELTDLYAERGTPILALGGGVIGDLAGFVAATYSRGVPLVAVPTTLLAQVDSSIGGKVAVDHGRLKNKVGVFYQPRLVITDIATLKTLDAGQFTNGLAEAIKSAVIWDSDFFSLMENNLDGVKSLESGILEEVVFRSARIKAGVVEKDERDLGLRSILNFGHTVGHALETVSAFAISHGEAVAMGMMAAARISNRMGILDKGELDRLGSLLKRAGLPVELPVLRVEEVIGAMKHDKKVVSGKVRFVLPRSIGEVFITDEVSLSLVEDVLGGR
ncbi:3-dehydroquinate synthase [Chloroflexota bacterium]